MVKDLKNHINFFSSGKAFYRKLYQKKQMWSFIEKNLFNINFALQWTNIGNKLLTGSHKSLGIHCLFAWRFNYFVKKIFIWKVMIFTENLANLVSAKNFFLTRKFNVTFVIENSWFFAENSSFYWRIHILDLKFRLVCVENWTEFDKICLFN